MSAQPLKNLEKQELLPERIADLIRDAILKGQLAPGARLIEQQLARQWTISRAPLREAIRQLATEGLVTLSPHRGARVSEVSEAALTELFAVREMIESFGAELAARNATPRQVAAMRTLISDMERCRRGNDLTGFYVAGLEFHNVLVAATGNAMLVQLYDQIKRQFRRYQATLPRVPDLTKNSIEEHRSILDAIERGDAQAAAGRARHHIRHLTEQVSDNAEAAGNIQPLRLDPIDRKEE